ncbi:MAG: hypothetical protein GY827_08355 [Cytophagales bacterium]|nr:hypothetical protein [Cytophagales bacterium]
MSNENTFFGNHVPRTTATTRKCNGVLLRGVNRRGNTINYFPAFTYANGGGSFVVNPIDSNLTTQPYEYYTVTITDRMGTWVAGSIKDGTPITIDVSSLAQVGTWDIHVSTGKEDAGRHLSRYDFNVSIAFDSASGGFDTGDELVRSTFSIDVANPTTVRDGDLVQLTTAVGTDINAQLEIENIGFVADVVFNVSVESSNGTASTTVVNPLVVATQSSETADIVFDGQTAGKYSAYVTAVSNNNSIFTCRVEWEVA